MKAKEAYEKRLQMAEMHDVFLERLDNAFNDHNFIEATWICYSIFEQRVNRLILKYIDYCKIPPREDDKTISISTRIKCLLKLVNNQYGVFAHFDETILQDILAWCDERNELTHGLVALDHYKKYETEFEGIAVRGRELVKRIYEEATKLREEWYDAPEPVNAFPPKCKCKKQQCINKNRMS